jgi:hypothetical protein
MKKILVSSALTLSVFFVLASASAKAQELFEFDSAYARPFEMVDGLALGARADIFAPTTVAVAPAVAAQKCPPGAACGRRRFAHAH